MSSLLQAPNRRYQLVEPIGRGGMGTVYSAHDRLTGQRVALKQVQVAPQALVFASRSSTNDTDGLLLSLAQEFRLLASLRHPHIISVLDYGFDAQRHPYFTMELLDQPQTLPVAGQGQPLAVQINLLIQTLQALTYLHRRGILHRDLKPDNILVSQGQVRVLDFGLSIGREQARKDEISGTLRYMAPEVLEGGAHSEAADLYSVGVIAYELFVGQHPFQSDKLDALLMQILEEEPDLAPLLALTPRNAKRTLPAILLQLLEKQAALRYQAAEEVIDDLCAVLGQPSPPESVAIRESFLQAATFVGREREMAQLLSALTQALHGQGSAWLIGGESGVGKSRLMDELRTQALVAGALVVRGQAVEGGGLPYQLWREPVRRLVLTTTLSELEAGVLKELVPDIALLLERTVPDAPPLLGAAARQRLFFTVVDLFKRQTIPLVLLLEDLQWSDKSLAILQQLTGVVTERPLLIVANYRDDEQTDLAAQLPSVQLIKLARLSKEQIRRLSAAMLGRAGQQGELVDLLQHETEGNTFFMVEAIHALAEAAGGLLDIGRMTLPNTILAGGIQQTLLRRLAQIPKTMHPLLQLAAVAGRQLELRVIGQWAGDKLDAWLAACSAVAVVETYDGVWRFTHDKLRSAVLTQIREGERPALHRQVAETIEAVYSRDEAHTSQAEILLDHWQRAEDQRKIVDYGLIVGERLVRYADYQRATALLQQSLASAAQLANADEQMMLLWRWLGRSFEQQALYEQATEAHQQSLHYAQSLGDVCGQSDALRGLGLVYWRQEKLASAVDLLKQALALAQETQDKHRIANLLSPLGSVIYEQGDQITGHRYTEEALALFRTLNIPSGIAMSLNNLADNLDQWGEHALAAQYLEECLTLARSTNNRKVIVLCLLNLSSNALRRGDFGACNGYANETLTLSNELNTRDNIPFALHNLAGSALCSGDFANAQRYFLQALAGWRELQIVGDSISARRGLSWLAEQQGDYPQALAYSEEGVQIAQSADIAGLLVLALSTHAHINFRLGHAQQATATLNQALALACEQDNASLLVEVLLVMLQVWLQAGQFVDAAQLVGLLDKQPTLAPILRIMYFNSLVQELQANLPANALNLARQQGKILELKPFSETILQQRQIAQ